MLSVFILRALRAPGLPGVSVPSVFENSVLSVRPACRAFPCSPCLYSVLSVFNIPVLDLF